MTKRSALRDELVICTRNRPDDLARCLGSVVDQRRLPARVTVVDSSDDDASEVVVRGWTGRLPVRHIPATPGLTHQRNVGVEAADGAVVVHFVDDDVVLEPGYLEAIVAVFEEDEGREIGGVGGLPTNLPRFRPNLVQRTIAPRTVQQGSVLPSGRGVLVYTAVGPVDVDWLSGCSMSYRREVLASHRFDEDLPGYGLGEDLDFSYRVRQDWRLVVTPAARLEHLQSPVNRFDRRRWARDDVVNRAIRVGTGVGSYRRSAFWASVIGQYLLYRCRGALRPDSGDREAARGIAEGARDCLRRRSP